MGRIVHLVQNGECYAAIVTRTRPWPAGASGPEQADPAAPVSLHVFFPGGSTASWGDPDRPAVPQDEDARGQDTWHWPERP